MSAATIFSLVLAFAATTLASPAKVTGTMGIATNTEIALAHQAFKTPGAEAALDAPPPLMTISVVNSYGDAISTYWAQNPGVPSAASGNVGAGTLANGAVGVLAVPTGWGGNVQINDAAYPINGDLSSIEASFDTTDESAVAISDIDVSFVDGFSVPITCQCVATGTWLAGCNLDLFSLNSCPDDDGEGACINPLRVTDTSPQTPSAFFAPCSGGAYLYPKDDSANVNGECQSSNYLCCVGSACPASDIQS